MKNLKQLKNKCYDICNNLLYVITYHKIEYTSIENLDKTEIIEKKLFININKSFFLECTPSLRYVPMSKK